MLYLALPITEKEAQCWVGFFGFWRQHILHLGVLLWPIWVTWKISSLSGTEDKRRFCDRSRLLCKLLCHLGHVTQQIQWGLEGEWHLLALLFWAFNRFQRVSHSTGLHRKRRSFWGKSRGLLLSLSRDWMLNHGASSYHATWAAPHELGVI